MKRVIGNLIVLGLVVAGISFFAAPAVAFFALRSAADAQDAAGLARLIDYGAVRQSLRPQMAARPEAVAPAPSFLEDPIAAVRRQFEPGGALVAGPDVDVYLTPAALAALTRGEGRYASQRSRPGAPASSDGDAEDLFPSPRHWGVNRVRMSVSDDGGSETFFTFERLGPFEWKLVHIGLPDGTAPAAATPSSSQGRSS